MNLTDFLPLYKDEWTNMPREEKDKYRAVAEELRKDRMSVKKTGPLAVLDVTKTWQSLVSIVSVIYITCYAALADFLSR